jgi:D-amino-acid dehydrogenase
MKIVVLGAGVIGVTSAYYLARSGHEVTVVDRQAAPGLETSFANAGEISPGYSAPWAAPGIPLKALKWLFTAHAPFAMRPSLDPHLLAWLGAMIGNCNETRYAINKERMMRLANFSRTCLIELRSELCLAYDQRTQGTLQVFRDQESFDHIDKDIAVLAASGVPFEVLDAKGCVCAEPGLGRVANEIVGGLRLPNDETGDCFKFTTQLAARCADIGVQFSYGSDIQGLDVLGGKVYALRTRGGTITADAYVVALGSYSPRLLRPLGIDLPVYPVKGYSITAPVTDGDSAPKSTVMDETYKVAITRLGDRIRVGGMAELAGFDSKLRPARQRTLEHSVGTLFPGGADLSKATPWCGLRPMTPDGTPVIGATKVDNLFLNTGHGTLGWTMACGSGRVLAGIIDRAEPPITISDLSIDRYRH